MMRRFCGVAAIAAAMAAATATAMPTEDSVLSCSPLRVQAGRKVTCVLRARDERHEPTPLVAPGDFAVRLATDTAAVAPQHSPLVVTADPTVLRFQVWAASGAHVRIDVALRRSGRLVRGSGAVALVLASPPLAVGKLTCTVEGTSGGAQQDGHRRAAEATGEEAPTPAGPAKALTLRDSVLCRVPVFGAGGIPAVADPAEFFMSEDHGDGTFSFVDGRGAVEFRFTAPAFPGAAYEAFALRVTLTGDVKQQAVAKLAVRFPVLPPTGRSTVHCSAHAGSCVVGAFDAQGPVAFRAADFRVDTLALERTIMRGDEGLAGRREEEATPEAAGEEDAPEPEARLWRGAGEKESADRHRWAATKDVVWRWEAMPTDMAAGRLRFRTTRTDKVFRAKIDIGADTTGTVPQRLLGAPFEFTAGTPPTPETLAFRFCDAAYLPEAGRATCYLSTTAAAAAVGLPPLASSRRRATDPHDGGATGIRVTADPHYIRVTATAGSVAGVRAANATALAAAAATRAAEAREAAAARHGDKLAAREAALAKARATALATLKDRGVIVFEFSAPMHVAGKVMAALSVEVVDPTGTHKPGAVEPTDGDAAGGKATVGPILRSPQHIFVYPQSMLENDRTEKHRGPVLAIGFLFFGSALVAGFAAFIRHTTHANKRNDRAKRRKAETLAAAKRAQRGSQIFRRQSLSPGAGPGIPVAFAAPELDSLGGNIAPLGAPPAPGAAGVGSSRGGSAAREGSADRSSGRRRSSGSADVHFEGAEAARMAAIAAENEEEMITRPNPM